MYGKPKQNRKKPVVQMGLAMDSDGIPLRYELFPGNKLDKQTFRSIIGEVRRNYDTGRIIVVADMGIITGDNTYYLAGDKQGKSLNGYVFSFSIRGGTDEFKSYVLDEKGYRGLNGKPVRKDTDFKIKSRVIARDIKVIMANGKKKTKTVYEKQVVFWSKKFYDKARMERAEVIKKAMDLIENPARYNRATSYSAAAYVTNLEFDKETGEVLEGEKIPTFNFDKLAEDEKYDGYYAIVTSELETRPVYVRIDEHMDAHFLSCFIALTIIRIIQRKLNKKYSTAAIIDCLKRISCSNEDGNVYLFNYRSKISDAIGKVFSIDFTRKRLLLGDIKKILGGTKK